MEAEAPVRDLSRTFVTPPELLRSRPRDVRLTVGGRALYVAALVLFAAALAVGISFHLKASRDAEHWATFDRESVSASAEITRLWRGSGDPKPAWVAYRFKAAGSDYAGQSKIRVSRWRALERGSAIEIRYLPTDPQQSVIVGGDRSLLPAWLAFVLAAAIGSGGVLFLVLLNGQRRLLMEGRPAPALVTAVVTNKTSHGGSHRSIKYTFPLLSGAIATGKSEAPRKAPAVGGVICVVYDADRPSRSRPYPFPLVRLQR